MQRLPIVTLVLAMTLGSMASSLRADYGQALGRYWGLGWGDGYHSRTACPPKRAIIPVARPTAATAKPAPWWMIPAGEAEQLPSPAPSDGGSGPGGPSLFRQPGEGSSNHSPAGPSIMR